LYWQVDDPVSCYTKQLKALLFRLLLLMLPAVFKGEKEALEIKLFLTCRDHLKIRTMNYVFQSQTDNFFHGK
jgi:hypothetical protein